MAVCAAWDDCMGNFLRICPSCTASSPLSLSSLLLPGTHPPYLVLQPCPLCLRRLAQLWHCNELCGCPSAVKSQEGISQSL